jgi:hypothetical protein
MSLFFNCFFLNVYCERLFNIADRAECTSVPFKAIFFIVGTPELYFIITERLSLLSTTPDRENLEGSRRE